MTTACRVWLIIWCAVVFLFISLTPAHAFNTDVDPPVTTISVSSPTSNCSHSGTTTTCSGTSSVTLTLTCNDVGGGSCVSTSPGNSATFSASNGTSQNLNYYSTDDSGNVEATKTETITFTVYSISGTVFIDSNHDGTNNDGAGGYSGASVSLSGPESGSTTTNGSGAYSFTVYTAGSYTVTTTVPSGYKATNGSCSPANCQGTTARSTTVGPNTTNFDFGVTQIYTITGTVYVDYNHDCAVNNVSPYGQDALYSGAPSIASSGGTVSTSAPGAFTISSLVSGSYNIDLSVPAGYTISSCDATRHTISVGPSTTTRFYITPYHTITGNLYVDYNHNGAYDASEDAAYNSSGNAIITITSGPSAGSSATGNSAPVTPNFSMANLLSGNYQVTLSVPGGYLATTTNPVVLNGLSTDVYVQFGITPLYTISGSVFVDTNKNTVKDAGENPYASTTSTLSVTLISPTGSAPAAGTTMSVDPSCNYEICDTDGAYTTGAILKSGTYRISYTSLPAPEYHMTYIPGTPPSFTVTVGKPGSTYSCNVGTHNDADCDASGNISSLNFGISNLDPWPRCEGGDCRCEGTLCSTRIPQNACDGPYASISNSTSTTPGIFFGGDNTQDFGQGQASPDPYNWMVGGNGANNYPELFSPVNTGVVRTSYDYLLTSAKQSGITVTDLAGSCTLSNCTLPSNLANGIYHAGGNVSLNAWTAPSNKNFVILVNGTLTIKGKISVPIGSTLLVSTSGDIHIDSSVGEAVYTSRATDIEGTYSADGSFIVDGQNNCTIGPDLRFNVGGTVIVNAGQTGGTLSLLRDMCQNDICPTITFIERPDFTLNAPTFIRHPNFVWKEVAP